MFKKIAEFFTGKKPEVAPEAPYKVEVAPVVEAAPASVASVPDTIVITPEAVAPNLVADTIVTEPAPVVETVTESAPVAAITAKPKKAKAPAKAKTATKPKTVAGTKKPRKPKSK